MDPRDVYVGQRVELPLPDLSDLSGRRSVVRVQGTVLAFDLAGLPRGVEIRLDQPVGSDDCCYATYGEIRSVHRPSAEEVVQLHVQQGGTVREIASRIGWSTRAVTDWARAARVRIECGRRRWHRANPVE